MESLSFMYMHESRVERLPLTIIDGAVSMRSIAQALGVRRKRGPEALDIAALHAWLTSITPASKKVRHFQDHLCEFIKEKSVSIRVKGEVEKTNARRDSEKIILVGHDLDSTDHFRKDASRGAAKITPDAIDRAARAGCVDLFVRPPSVWGDEPTAIQRMTVDMSAYRPNLLQDYRRGNVEVLTGPQMVERYPDSPLVKRKIIPERWSVENGILVRMPEHAQRFSWES